MSPAGIPLSLSGHIQGKICRYVTFHFLVAVYTIITCEKKDGELFFSFWITCISAYMYISPPNSTWPM